MTKVTAPWAGSRIKRPTVGPREAQSGNSDATVTPPREAAGAASGCMVAAALLWAGAPVSLGILLSLLGTAAIFVLLRRYYGKISFKALPSSLGPSAG